MPVAIAFAIQVLTQLPALIQAGVDAVSAIEQALAALHAMQAENREPTKAEWDALDTRITTDMARLDTAARDPA